MLKRILFVVTATPEALKATGFVAELALATGARIIALSIIDTAAAKHLTAATGASESETLVKLEQDAWHYLYDVEDACKARGAQIVLQQEEGFPVAKISATARRFGADVVVVPRSRSSGQAQSRSEKTVAALIERLACPVIVV